MSDVTPSNADKANAEPVDAAVEETPATAPEATLPAANGPHADESTDDEPALAEPAVDEPAPELIQPEPVPADTATVRSAVSQPDDPAVAEPVAEPAVAGSAEPVDGEPVVVPTAVPAASTVPAQQIYLQPDLPPKKRGNRLIGVLLALVGAAIFAGVYAVVVVAINHFEGGRTFGKPSSEFVNVFGSAYFTVAVGAFLVLMILLVLLLNRAGWWAHVLGSLILAIAVYFVAIGGLLFIGNTLKYSPETLTFAGLAVSPWVVAAAVVAREVSIWTGLGIAARGRRVKARNVEDRAAFDREQEAKKADYAATGPVAGS